MYDYYLDDYIPCDFCFIPNCKNKNNCGVFIGDEDDIEVFNKYAEKYNGIKIFIEPDILCYVKYFNPNEEGWGFINPLWAAETFRSSIFIY